MLKPFGHHLQHYFLWQFNRQAVAGGAAVGVFFGILMPFAQILFAALSAIALRVNLPVAVLATLVSNPLTFAPMYYVAYRLGDFLLSGLRPDSSGGIAEQHALDEKVDTLLAQQAEVSGWMENLMSWVSGVGPALTIGLIVLAVAVSALAYLTISGLWRLYTLRRWRRRPGFQPFRLRSWETRTILPRQLALAIGLVGFFVVAAVDAATTARVSLLPLHLMPVMFVTWYVSAGWGIGFAAAMVVVQVLTGLQAGLNRDLYWQIDLGADFLAVVFLVALLTHLRNMRENLVKMVRHDSLTNTLNRNGFYSLLEMEIERCRRYGHPFSLIYLGCDNFRQVNDTQGHRAGDRLLKRVARSLRENLRKIDGVGRLGGDEFAVLLPETDSDSARRTAAHLKEKMDAAMAREKWLVSFSMGVASFSKPPASPESAIERADRLMLRVKRSSKNNVAYQAF